MNIWVSLSFYYYAQSSYARSSESFLWIYTFILGEHRGVKLPADK